MEATGRIGGMTPAGAREPLLPSDREAEAVVLGPESLVWQRFGDVRLFAASGYALLLQVAHPTVGAGVRDHSTFERDPWGRLLRTVDYLYLLTYGGLDAARVGRQLRELHKPIRGANPDGSRYHALEPEAYAWVHATLVEGAIRAHLRFVGPLTPGQIEQIYAEYAPLGRLLGVRSGDLPASWAGFCEYFDATIRDTLVRHETVDRVLGALARPAAPPELPGVLDPLWKVVRPGPAHAFRVATIGLLPPILRERFGLRWTATEELELRVLGAASRALGPVLPSALRNAGPRYLRWRAPEIERGPLGHGAPSAAAAS